VTVKHFGVESTIAVDVRIDLVHELLPILVAHVDHHVLNRHKLVLINDRGKVDVLFF
jgi:hypothetical protein